MSDHEEDDAVAEYYKNNPKVFLEAPVFIETPEQKEARRLRLEEVAENKRQRVREQRRYEISRDVLAAIVRAAWDEDKVLKGQVDAFEAAERAVHYADVLLEELDIPAE